MPQYSITREDFDLNQSLPNDPTFDFTNANSDRFPEIVLLADGDFLVLWRSPQNLSLDPDRNPGSAFQRFNADGTPEGPLQNFEGVFYDDVAPLADGGWVIAGRNSWVRFDSAGAQVASGTVADPATQGGLVNIIALEGGGWVVAWNQNMGGGNYQIYTQSFSAAGVAGAVTPLGTGVFDGGSMPMLTALDGGGFAATWVENDGAAGRNVHISYNGVESVIDGASNMASPDIALLPDGRLILTYYFSGSIYAAFVGVDGSVGTPFVADDTDPTGFAPRVATFPDGRFVLVWATGSVNDFQVYLRGQVFEADGSPVDAGEPFFVGFIPSDSDYSVIALNATDFVVSWSPYGTTDRTLNGTLFSVVAAEVYNGTPGPDVHHGTNADDVINGLGGADQLYGEDGNDVIDGGTEADHMVGGFGDDVYYVDNAGDTIVETHEPYSGDDRVYTTVSYALPVYVGVDFLYALDPAGTDPLSLRGSAYTRLVVGNAGANILQGGSATLEGLGGDDVYFNDLGSSVVEAVGGGYDRFYTALTHHLRAGSEVEVLSTNNHAGTVAIDLYGNEFAQTLAGNAGANRLDGGGGADYMVGFGGNDTYIVDNEGDLVDEAGAANSLDIVIASVSYTLVGGVQIDELRAFDPTGYSPIDLYGNSFAQLIVGNAANNTLYGRGGADILRGLEGNDTYLIDTAGTLVEEVGNQGNDAIYTGVSYALGGNVYVETLSTNNHGATVAINLTGNGINQTLVGNQGANSLHGGGGVDELIGFGGNDTYFTDVAATLAWESAGGGNDALYTSVSYTLQSGTQIETLSTNNHGAIAAINLNGNEIGQTIVGNAGANMLDGKGGADYLLGFGGQDIFAFTTALGGGNVDTILDFQSGQDKVGLDDAIFTGIGGPGALGPDAFATGTGAADASDRIIYNAQNGALYYDADGNGAGAAIQFATIGTGLTLSASDFMVI